MTEADNYMLAKDEVAVLFNDYLRMAVGCTYHFAIIPLEAGMTIKDLEILLRLNLRIERNDPRFRLCKYVNDRLEQAEGSQILSKLRPQLRQHPSYFQLQMDSNCEDCKHLGVSTASNLTLYTYDELSRQTPKIYYCYLQGTSLFYRPSESSRSSIFEIKRIHQCRVDYHNLQMESDEYSFDVVQADGVIYTFSSTFKDLIDRWVQCLQACKPSEEISEIMNWEDLIKKGKTKAFRINSISSIGEEEIMKRACMIGRAPRQFLAPASYPGTDKLSSLESPTVQPGLREYNERTSSKGRGLYGWFKSKVTRHPKPPPSPTESWTSVEEPQRDQSVQRLPRRLWARKYPIQTMEQDYHYETKPKFKTEDYPNYDWTIRQE